jgi:hypothetical protein
MNDNDIMISLDDVTSNRSDHWSNWTHRIVFFHISTVLGSITASTDETLAVLPFWEVHFLWTERDSTDSAHFCRVFPLYQRLPAVTLPGVTRWPVSRSPGRWALARQTLSPIKHGWEIPELASYGKLGKSWTKFGGFSSHVWWWQEGEFCVAKHRILICKNQHNS